MNFRTIAHATSHALVAFQVPAMFFDWTVYTFEAPVESFSIVTEPARHSMSTVVADKQQSLTLTLGSDIVEMVTRNMTLLGQPAILLKADVAPTSEVKHVRIMVAGVQTSHIDAYATVTYLSTNEGVDRFEAILQTAATAPPANMGSLAGWKQVGHFWILIPDDFIPPNAYRFEYEDKVTVIVSFESFPPQFPQRPAPDFDPSLHGYQVEEASQQACTVAGRAGSEGRWRLRQTPGGPQVIRRLNARLFPDLELTLLATATPEGTASLDGFWPVVLDSFEVETR